MFQLGFMFLFHGWKHWKTLINFKFLYGCAIELNLLRLERGTNDLIIVVKVPKAYLSSGLWVSIFKF
jgi:hypothetical protein